jgi:hypothetical protein
MSLATPSHRAAPAARVGRLVVATVDDSRYTTRPRIRRAAPSFGHMRHRQQAYILMGQRMGELH